MDSKVGLASSGIADPLLPRHTNVTERVDDSTSAKPTSGEIFSQVEEPERPSPSPIVIKGTGQFSKAADGPSSSAKAPGSITLNFVDTDIREVIKGVLGDILGLTYVINPNVAGKITIKSNVPLARAELLPTLEQVLSANGLSLVEADGRYTVALLQDIKQVAFVSDAQHDGYGNQIVRLRYIGASEIEKVLSQFAQAGSVKLVSTAPNLVVISGNGPTRATLLDIVNVFDVDRFAGTSFAIFPLSSVDPQTLIKELKSVFAAGGLEANLQGILDFMPIDRLNAILAISADPRRLDQVKTWIDRLDQSESSDEKKLYVHYVQHGEAKHIADVLRRIFLAKGDGAEDKSGNDPNPEAERESSGPEAQAPATSNGDVVMAQPAQDRYAFPAIERKAEQTDQPTVDGSSKVPSANADEQVRIIADDRNNALFVVATPKIYKQIDAAIKHLDVTPVQVMIEATIAEVTLNKSLKYGVQWFFKSGDSTVTLSDVATGAVAAAFPGFGYVFAGDNTKVVLNALDKVTDVKVISSPQIMVLDNRTAKLQVGDQVPIATQSAVSVTTPDAPVVNSIEYKDTGVILTVTPRVNSSGTVGLDIDQEVSDVAPTTTSGLDSPTIQQRKLKSSVTVQDGETIALGGLIRDNQSKGKSGVPILSDVPLLGNLFGTTQNSGDRTELLVLLTPHVVRNPDEAREITDELRRRVKSLGPLDQKLYSDGSTRPAN
jgi:general secretion pathway protein D